MRILKILACHYDDCIRQFYRKHRFVKDLSYNEHMRFLENYSPVHINRFSHYMGELGHEAAIVVSDLESLQESWAFENDFRYSREHWKVDIILQQIEAFQPEVLYLQDVYVLPHFIRKRIKTFYPCIKKVILFRGFPGAMNEVKDVDLVFAGTPMIKEEFEQEGFNVEMLYHGFEENVLLELERLESNERERFPLSFLGYSGYGGHGECHKERYHLLIKLLEKTGISIWTSETEAQQVHEKDDSIQPLKTLYPQRVKQSFFGLAMYDILNRSDIVFNKHTEAARGIIGNMRLFESTGAGACLLTDSGPNMKELFEEDREIVTYQSDEELFEKIAYLNDHPKIRNEIASAGQKRTLKEHTIRKRCEFIAGRISDLLSS